MIKRLLILLLLLTLVTRSSLSQDINKDNQLRNLVREYRQADVTIPYPGADYMNILTRNVSITSVRDKKVIINISPRTIDWFISQKFDYLILERPDFKGIKSAASVSDAMAWQSYPTYFQYDSIMRSFSTLYPSLCHLDTIGTSINGKLVLALKISDNAGTNEDEPEVFYSSTMHGNEVAGFILMLRLADYLLKNYTLNYRVKNIVDNLEIWINPLANPDGTFYSGNITGAIRGNANFIDLNRNFPDPLDPSIVQQKETKDMIKFMRKHKFVISANFHSGEEVVNYPWDRWSRLHADNEWFIDISRSFADTVHNHSVAGYMTFLNNGITNGYQWYSIEGGRQDFVTYELQGREVTIELDNTFITPTGQLESLWQYNWRSFLGFLENALYGIHGAVKDSRTLLPVAAKVYISGHDKDSSHVYSDTLTGKFTRFLAPGIWDLTFSAKGYRDTTIANVIVVQGQKTDLTVEMRLTDLPVVKVPLLYPNPVTSILTVILPEDLSGKVNIKIISQSGAKVADYNKDFLPGFPLEIDVRGMSGGSYIIIFTNSLSGVSYRCRFIVTGRYF